MPIYEYQCTACGHHLEAIQKMSDAPLTDCPECSQSALKKLVSAAGFQLKGSGWYVTDYSAKGKSKAAKDSESSPAAKTEAPAAETAKKEPSSSGGSTTSNSGDAS